MINYLLLWHHFFLRKNLNIKFLNEFLFQPDGEELDLIIIFDLKILHKIIE